MDYISIINAANETAADMIGDPAAWTSIDRTEEP
jgi:hypothetical protein